MPTVDHLRVARHDAHARFFGHFGHARANTLELIHRIALFKDEPAAQELRNGTAGCNIVHRTAHGQAPDIAARKELRGDHEAVGRKRDALTFRRFKARGIIANAKLFTGIRLEEHLVDDALHHRTAASVP